MHQESHLSTSHIGRHRKTQPHILNHNYVTTDSHKLRSKRTKWGVHNQMLQLYKRHPELQQRIMSALKITLSHGSPPVFVSLNSTTPDVPAPASSSCRLRAWKREGPAARRGSRARTAWHRCQRCPPGPCPRKHLVPRDGSVLRLCPTLGQLVPTKVILKQAYSQQNVMFRSKTNLYVLEG